MSTELPEGIAGQAEGPGVQELAEAIADHVDGQPESFIRIDERDVAADLGAIDPAAVASIDRPDGRPGFSEQYAGAHLVDAESLPASAELRLREGDQPLPTGDTDAPNIHELVMTDLGNRMELGKARYGQPLKPHNGRDPLRDAYEELLDGAAYLRQAMFERDGA